MMDEYRLKADVARDQARQEKDPAIREKLMRLAFSCEELADELDGSLTRAK